MSGAKLLGLFEKREAERKVVLAGADAVNADLLVVLGGTVLVTMMKFSLGKFAGSLADQADQYADSPWELDTGARDFKNGYLYGVRW